MSKGERIKQIKQVSRDLYQRETMLEKKGKGGFHEEKPLSKMECYQKPPNWVKRFRRFRTESTYRQYDKRLNCECGKLLTPSHCLTLCPVYKDTMEEVVDYMIAHNIPREIRFVMENRADHGLRLAWWFVEKICNHEHRKYY